jgi:hypothetical protein
MDVDHYQIGAENCDRLTLMLPSDAPLKGTFAGKYINWGEREGYHLGATCAAREGEDGHRWYDLTGARIAPLFWPKSHQYRHCAPRNAINVIANCNPYTVELASEQVSAAFGVLNSSLAILSKHLHGRPVGVEANLKTEVVDVNMMLVPDWTAASPEILRKVARFGEQVTQRGVLGLLSARRLRQKSLVEKGRESELESISDETELDQPEPAVARSCRTRIVGDPDICAELASRLRAHRDAREAKVRELLEERTADPDLMEKAIAFVLPRFRRYAETN